MISLQFPGYAAQHPQHVVWLMHSTGAAYELFDPTKASEEAIALRNDIHRLR